MRPTRNERDVVDAVPGGVERAKLELSTSNRLAVGDARIGRDVGQRMREQRGPHAFRHVGDIDDMVTVAVGAQDVRDRDLLARGSLF